MAINTDKLIEATDIIAQNVLFINNKGLYRQRSSAWLFDKAMRALDTKLAPLAVTYSARCRYAGDVYVTIRRDGSYAIRRKETVDKYNIELA